MAFTGRGLRSWWCEPELSFVRRAGREGGHLISLKALQLGLLGALPQLSGRKTLLHQQKFKAAHTKNDEIFVFSVRLH